MKTSRLLVIGLIAAGTASRATAASAQDMRPEVSVGYLNVMGTMHGGNAQVLLPLDHRFGLVGEFDMSKGRDCGDCDPLYRDKAGLGGVRVTWLGDRRISPFSQFLAGGLDSHADGYYEEYCCGLGRRLRPALSVNYAALQPGGGVTVRVNRRLAIRAQTDIQFGIPNQAEFEGISIFPRAVAAAVIRLGK